MASLKEIKNRITSVQSTRKITSAMKMVASSKLHHAQQMIENMLPYEGMLEHILKTFLASDVDAKGSITQARPVKTVALLAFSSNSSLCGGFNSNVLKLTQKAIDGYQKNGVKVITSSSGSIKVFKTSFIPPAAPTVMMMQSLSRPAGTSTPSGTIR